MTAPEFVPFPKIPRLKRDIIVTEKIDGTNAVVHIGEDGAFLTGSRTRWITPEDDNFGFAKWAHENRDELMKLGLGTHYGEWWGMGIQRRYNGATRRFSLFNTSRWAAATERPSCCDVVPVLYSGPFDDAAIEACLEDLRVNGSRAAPGFMKPEGVIVFHAASRSLFKRTLEKDEAPKGIAVE
jgi:hypothetical protein